MFERFTDRARRVIVLAQEEARLLNHDYIGTEHILLGLIQEADGLGCQALTSLDISLEVVREQVREIVGEGRTPPAGHIPFTPRAKKVLEFSLREALQLGHDYIGTEHLLLGLIREGEGVAAQVLRKLGADLEGVRRAVIDLVESGPARRAASPEAASAASEDEPKGQIEPRCPQCHRRLADFLSFKTLTVKERDGAETRDVVVVFCGDCGTALGAF